MTEWSSENTNNSNNDMNVTADLPAIARLLQSCRTHHSLRRGQQLHLLLLKSGVSSSIYYGNCLLHMYCRCTCVAGTSNLFRDARLLFDEMPLRNSFTWNILIDAHARYGDLTTSVELFYSMPAKNVFSWNAIIAGTTRGGDVELSRRLFDEMPVKDAVSLNSVMHGFVQEGRALEALRICTNVNLVNDGFVVATALTACSRLAALACGKQVHARAIISDVKFDSVLSSALVDMYCKCGDLENAVAMFDSMVEPDEFSMSAIISGYSDYGRCDDARRVFDRSRNQSIVCWNSMLKGYTSNGRCEEALQLFTLLLSRENGVRVDPSTFASVLNACLSLDGIENGKQVHAQAFKFGVTEDVVVGTATVDLYSKRGITEDALKAFNELKEYDTVSLNSMIYTYSNCGRIEEARQAFDTITDKTLISWNSMIVGYSQNACAMEAIELFREMHKLGLKMDQVTFSTILSACACISSLGLGEQIFAMATIIGLAFDHIVSTSLIDLYCKCGFVEISRKLFNETRKSDDALWNSMLMGYAMNGRGVEALNLFEDMRNANVKPNQLTFIGILTACCHCGFVEKGQRLFSMMRENYNIEPNIEHYSCMVDLLARAGWLGEAINLVDGMPFKADAGILTSLLKGCNAQGDDFLGRKIAEKLIEIDPSQTSSYVQLSSVYATHGEWKRSEQIREMMREKHIMKEPGCSWINE